MWDKGLRVTDIASQLDISKACVRHHFLSIRRKLEIQDIGAMVDLVRERFGLERAYLPLSGRLNRRPAGGITLSATEALLLEGVAEGLSYNRLAARSGKSITTLYNAAASVRSKLAAANNAEALTKAVNLGLLDLPAMDDRQGGAERVGDDGSTASGQTGSAGGHHEEL